MKCIMKNGFVSLFLLSVIFFNCNNFLKQFPSVSVVVGFVELIRNGNTEALSEGQKLKESDTLKTQRYSKAKLQIKDGELYLNSLSCIGVADNTSQTSLSGFIFHSGELFLNYKSDTVNLTLSTPLGLITVLSSELSLKYDPEEQIMQITPLYGNVKFKTLQNDEHVIPQCHTVLIHTDIVKEPFAITEPQIAKLKGWVGETAINEALALGNCESQKVFKKRSPPEWIKFPKKEITAGEYLVDTVAATGYDSSEIITYKLINGPDEFRLDSITGIIRFKPSRACSVNILIRAKSQSTLSSDLEYTLKVSSTPQALLKIPSVVLANQVFDITASVSGTDLPRSSFLYRFDLNGDGYFDYPESAKFGKFSKIDSFSFPEEGYKKISVEIKDVDNNFIVSRSRKIFVNTPPKASIEVVPQSGTVETEFVIDVTGCSDSHDSTHVLNMQIDTYVDNNWKLLKYGNISDNKTLVYRWETPGSYLVRLIVTDSFGMSDTVSRKIDVARSYSIELVSSSDFANPGEAVLFTCIPSDPQIKVKVYEWNFGNDSLIAKTTENRIEHVFSEAGKYVVNCRITDENGMEWQNKKEIIINKAEIRLDAKGPYKADINKELTVEGTITDPNKRIAAYKWDFDGDKKADWFSGKTSKATYTYTRSGKYVIWLIGEADDGETVSDSAVVEITNSKPTANAGEDMVSRAGRKVKLTGTGKDKDNNIVRYEWDFDGDGKMDWSSRESGVTKYAFEEYSTAVLTVIDSDSAKTSDSIRIVICPDGMETIETGKFCIDKYEWPNNKGEQPRVNVTYEEARKACLDAGKRLCSPAEWEMACKGEKEKNNYPYGAKYMVENCNTMGNPVIKNSISTSGHFLKCVGTADIYDMSGNVAEWTEAPNGKPYVYGGSWQNGKNGSRCNSRIELESGRKYFYAGFRCCK